jgi:hypothetical protein
LNSTSGFNLDNYKWSTLLPLIGGGFYVTPMIVGDSESYSYRVGYGFHNTYLFVFEQDGIFAALAFLYLLYAIIRKLNFLRNVGVAADRAFAIAALSYMLASLPVYLAGQIFWKGFDTGHFNAFLLIVLLIALRPAGMIIGKCAMPMRGPVLRQVGRVTALGATAPKALRNLR